MMNSGIAAYTVWLLLGGAVGALNGLTLRWTVNRLRPEAALAGVPLMMAGFLLRLVLAAALLVLASRRGVAPGLLACTGLWLARWGVIWWVARSGGQLSVKAEG
jgi:hypothetical protein